MDNVQHKFVTLCFATILLVALLTVATNIADRFAKVAKRRLAYRPRMQLNASPAPAVIEGSELIGTKPGEWTVSEWLNSAPLTLESLRGKVVLVRWWTAPDCPYCEKSAPALNEFWQRYKVKGLVVVGMYHHKADMPLTREHVELHAKKFGFDFPVAIDTDWKTLHRWWLNTAPRRLLGGGQ